MQELSLCFNSQNRAKALKLLRAKLFEKERMQQAMARSSLRLEQVINLQIPVISDCKVQNTMF